MPDQWLDGLSVLEPALLQRAHFSDRGRAEMSASEELLVVSGECQHDARAGVATLFAADGWIEIDSVNMAALDDHEVCSDRPSSDVASQRAESALAWAKSECVANS